MYVYYVDIWIVCAPDRKNLVMPSSVERRDHNKVTLGETVKDKKLLPKNPDQMRNINIDLKSTVWLQFQQIQKRAN